MSLPTTRLIEAARARGLTDSKPILLTTDGGVALERINIIVSKMEPVTVKAPLDLIWIDPSTGVPLRRVSRASSNTFGKRDTVCVGINRLHLVWYNHLTVRQHNTRHDIDRVEVMLHDPFELRVFLLVRTLRNTTAGTGILFQFLDGHFGYGYTAA